MNAEERDFLDEFHDEGESETADEAANTEANETETAETPEAETPEEPEAPAAPEAQKETHVPYAAMKAEREKRQERERELQERDRRIADYERQLKDLRNGAQPEKQPEQPVEIWEDPDAFVRQRVQAVEQQATNRLYAALEAQARDTFPDYDEMFAVVQEHAKTNPTISQQVLSAPNPALAAYKLGKQLAEMKQMEDPEAYRAKLKAELLAEIQADNEAKADAKRKAADAIPPDLSSSRSVTGQETGAPEDTFDALFPRN